MLKLNSENFLLQHITAPWEETMSLLNGTQLYYKVAQYL